MKDNNNISDRRKKVIVSASAALILLLAVTQMHGMLLMFIIQHQQQLAAAHNQLMLDSIRISRCMKHLKRRILRRKTRSFWVNPGRTERWAFNQPGWIPARVHMKISTKFSHLDTSPTRVDPGLEKGGPGWRGVNSWPGYRVNVCMILLADGLTRVASQTGLVEKAP